MRIKRITKEFIFDELNARVASVHASTIVKLKNGDLVAAWFGGTREHNRDVRIWVSLRHDGEWMPPYMIDDGMDVAHWNPVLFVNGRDELCLYYKVGEEISNWQTFIAKSADGGRSFGDIRELVPGDVGGRGPVKNKPIRLSNGTIVAPASNEEGDWYAFMDISEDDGESWSAVKIEKPEEPYTKQKLFMIQPTLWEEPAGHVHALMRTTRGYAYRTDSCDFGKTWCTSYISTVPNNNSGLDLVRMEDGTVALVSNPVSAGWGGNRTPLTLAFSDDNGLTFTKVATLEDRRGEYSYPSIIVDGKTLYVTFTYDRKTIAFVEVECY
ncbi:MAG: exo-alpha-sialidase [Clostridia bacterium]|nr:exo-alpha-sialidase [Clostridia bacterium]